MSLTHAPCITSSCIVHPACRMRRVIFLHRLDNFRMVGLAGIAKTLGKGPNVRRWGTGGSQTHPWREMDSNFRFLVARPSNLSWETGLLSRKRDRIC